MGKSAVPVMYDEGTIEEVLERTDVASRILGDYAGEFMLGVTRAPSGNGFAIVLKVEGDKLDGFPRAITVDGDEIPVVVRGGFRKVVPLRR